MLIYVSYGCRLPIRNCIGLEDNVIWAQSLMVGELCLVFWRILQCNPNVHIISHLCWKSNLCHGLQSTLTKLEVVGRNRSISIIVVCNYSGAKGVGAVTCNEGNVVFEVRGGSFDSYSLILVRPNFSGPPFSHLEKRLW